MRVSRRNSFTKSTLLRHGDLLSLLKEAHEVHTVRDTNALAEATAPKTSFSKTVRATILSKAGAVGRAFKHVFSYGMEYDPVIAADFLAKLTLHHQDSQIPIYDSKVVPRSNCIPLKAGTNAFSGMPKNSAADRDGWTWELPRDVAERPTTAALLRKFAELFSNGALLGFGPDVPLPQEAPGGQVSLEANPSPGHFRLHFDPFRLQSNGENE